MYFEPTMSNEDNWPASNPRAFKFCHQLFRARFNAIHEFAEL